ncbi:MAG: hypothetical protein MZU79_01405 [Anaerotruncus sp.]|nr:hypothetical protein [Anaerotruncus sp.]
MPGQTASYIFLLMNVKNADLGFAIPPTPQVVDPTAPAAPKLLARVYTFVQFYKLQDGKAPNLEKEIYIPAAFQADQDGVRTPKPPRYSFGYPLTRGNDLAAVALSSPTSQKFGIQHYEFALPDSAGNVRQPITSPALFMNNYAQTEQPETQAELHGNQACWPGPSPGSRPIGNGRSRLRKPSTSFSSSTAPSSTPPGALTSRSSSKSIRWTASRRSSSRPEISSLPDQPALSDEADPPGHHWG